MRLGVKLTPSPIKEGGLCVRERRKGAQKITRIKMIDRHSTKKHTISSKKGGGVRAKKERGAKKSHPDKND